MTDALNFGRRELQKLAKKHGIRANAKSTVILNELSKLGVLSKAESKKRRRVESENSKRSRTKSYKRPPAKKIVKASSPAPPSHFYTLSKEKVWAKWEGSGSNGIETCSVIFNSVSEAQKYVMNGSLFGLDIKTADEAQTYIAKRHGCLLGAEYKREWHLEGGGKSSWVFTEVHDDVETDIVTIHKHVVSTKPVTKAKKRIFYKLHKEHRWNSWDHSGLDTERCDLQFSTKQEAAKYAPNLIEMWEVFERDYNGEMTDIDKRRHPPDTGVVLAVKDMEGDRQEVIITKYEV